MQVFARFLGVVALICLYAGPAAAQPPEDDPARTLEECQKRYDACYAACRNKHPQQDLSGDAARTACGSACASRFTACKAQIELETKAKPQLEKMIDEIKRLLDEFMKQIPGPKPEKAPEPKDDGSVKT